MILQFLKAWLEWVEKGAPEKELFSRKTGLCGNLDQYCRFRGISREDAWNCLRIFESMLRKDRLSSVYPFNTGALEYNEECAGLRIHQNVARLLWVRNTIRKMENQYERSRLVKADHL
jgi:hypothetical protein